MEIKGFRGSVSASDPYFWAFRSGSASTIKESSMFYHNFYLLILKEEWSNIGLESEFTLIIGRIRIQEVRFRSVSRRSDLDPPFKHPGPVH